MLRRDWDGISTGADLDVESAYHFNIPVRFNESAMSMFEANYTLNFQSLDGRIDHSDVDEDERPERNRIAPFMQATRRGHFLVPPITLRSLPTPRAMAVGIEVEQKDDRFVVDVDVQPGKLDDSTVRFGRVRDVNRGQGAKPVEKRITGGSVRYVFPEDGVDSRIYGEGTAKLFAKIQRERKPVVGSTSL